MSETAEPEQLLQPYSVDQLGGFVVMVAGAIGSLLLVIWQSNCLCKINLCYVFQCERRPRTEEQMKSLKKKTEELKNKKNGNKDIEKADDKDETIIPPKKTTSKVVEPEPEPEFDDAVP